MEPGNPESAPKQPGEVKPSEATEAAKVEGSAPLSPEEMDQATYWLEQMAKESEEKKRTEKVAEPTECETAVSELNEIFETWLAPEKLEALHALSTEAEAVKTPLRAEAKLAMGEILKRINVAKKSLPSSETDPLMAKYKLVSRAVGVISRGLVDHTR